MMQRRARSTQAEDNVAATRLDISMTEAEMKRLLDALFPLVPGLFEELQAGIEALDLSCGSGQRLHWLAKAFPRSVFTGYDASEAAVSAARLAAKEAHITNISFAVKEATALNEWQSYSLITACPAALRQTQSANLLACIAQALRDDGVLVMRAAAASEMATPLAAQSAPYSDSEPMQQWLSAGFQSLEITYLPESNQTYYIARKR